MFRYLLIVFIIWAGIMIIRQLYLKRQDHPESRQLPAEQNMVRCTHCGVHLPEMDAVKDNQKTYCCEAHKLAARK